MTGDCHAGILWEPGGEIPPGDPTSYRGSVAHRSVIRRAGFAVCMWLAQVLFEVVSGLHSELPERLAEVVVDGAGADEQLRSDFLVGGPVGGEAGDLCFLRGQVVARLDGPFARVLAGRPELDPGAFGECFNAELREQRVGGA